MLFRSVVEDIEEIVVKITNETENEEEEERVFVEPEDDTPVIMPIVEEEEEEGPKPILPKSITEKSEETDPGVRYSYIYETAKNLLEEIEEIETLRLHEIAGIKNQRALISRRNTGRYRGFRIPKGKTADPAFDATIRAAAPYQTHRDSRGLSINIEKQDIREKVRDRKSVV